MPDIYCGKQANPSKTKGVPIRHNMTIGKIISSQCPFYPVYYVDYDKCLQHLIILLEI